MIAICWCLSVCVSSRDSGPLTYRLSPVLAASFPSKVIADFTVTKGSPFVMNLLKISFICCDSVAKQPYINDDSRFSELSDAASCNQRVRIRASHNNASRFCSNDAVTARRRPPMVAARLKRYIDCRAFGCCSGHRKGMHFGMTFAPLRCAPKPTIRPSLTTTQPTTGLISV